MTKSNFAIIKQCVSCGNIFEAYKRTTQCCSGKCSSKNYKNKKRLEIKKEVEQETQKNIALKPKIKSIDLTRLIDKPFLTVKEVALLFNCSKWSIYRMIQDKQINAINIGVRITRIRYKDIQKLFDQPKIESSAVLTTDNCYKMQDIIDKYSVSRNTIYNYGTKHNIQKIKYQGKTYYSKVDIDNLFNT